MVNEMKKIEDVEALINITDSGDRLYESMFRRNFGSETPKIQEYLLKNKYATKSKAYRCPHCNFLIGDDGSKGFRSELKQSCIICYSCGEEFKTREIDSELLLIRTDKKL